MAPAFPAIATRVGPFPLPCPDRQPSALSTTRTGAGRSEQHRTRLLLTAFGCTTVLPPVSFP